MSRLASVQAGPGCQTQLLFPVKLADFKASPHQLLAHLIPCASLNFHTSCTISVIFWLACLLFLLLATQLQPSNSYFVLSLTQSMSAVDICFSVWDMEFPEENHTFKCNLLQMLGLI